ncbi:MAG TPA: fluoride efflux transporter CrcB [Solirubrobacteraceae bacterium]|nr:fluoride efflux transporter CrcB [Solirubrobacteraceae bacterium]
MSALDWLIAAVAGGLGAYARFFVDGVVSLRAGREFPYGTLIVNLSGAVALGLISGAALSHTGETLLGTATVGAYTTFSTWMLETQRLAEDGEVAPVYLNVLVSLFAGLGAVALGRAIGHHL